MSATNAHATPNLAEADRLMTVCNSCRYCEGLCAVFPAMELRRTFADSDLNYLANLCHACGACYIDCQFSPPHEFNVNVPKVLAEVRNDSYTQYVWPRCLAGLFARGPLTAGVAVGVSVLAFFSAFLFFGGREALFAADLSPGRFYQLMPHNAMVLLFSAAFGYAALAMAMAIRAFWRDTGGTTGTSKALPNLWSATRDAATLHYLDGGKAGCFNHEEHRTDRRRLFHHLTFYGFLLCFASTVTATLWHYYLQREAPYLWYELPVLLGSIGGIGLTIGPVGLLIGKLRGDEAVLDRRRFPMDLAFLVLLAASGATGLALLIFRGTGAMGLLLALHLAVVLSLAITMPYGKFVHGLYRFVALARYAAERHGLSGD